MGDKVTLGGTVERTGAFGRSVTKDHIHAEEVERHSDGTYTITDHDGNKFERDDVETIGSNVKFTNHEEKD